MSETTKASPVRDRRLRLGLTLRQLADRCTAEGAPIHYSQLSLIERDLAAPRPALRATLAKILELDAVNDFVNAAS